MNDSVELGFIHRFEPATQAGAPTLLLLHGSGGDQNSLLSLGRAIAPGAALISPRGNATDHGAPRFFPRPLGHAGYSEEIQTRTSELAVFVRAASERYNFPQPLILVGFSSGANMAVHLLLNAKAQWAGAILIRGMAADDYCPHDNLRATPVLILSGLADPLVQTDQAQDLAAQLRNAGAAVTLHWEETGHNMAQGDVLMAFDWIRRFYTLPRPPSATQ